MTNNPTRKTRNNPERDLVMKPILVKLLSDPEIIWFERTASFQIGTLRVGHPGSPDITAVVDCKNGKVALWFIECKAPKIKVLWASLPYEQRKFFAEMSIKPMTLCSIINNPSQYESEKKKVQNL